MNDEARLSASRETSAVDIDTPSPSSEPERLRQLLDMAFWHNEAGNLSGAVMACEAALKLDPNSTSALSLLGCLYEKLGDDAKAIDAFERVVQLNPDSTADYEKLEHLLRGIRHKAVNPSLVHQLTPPVLLRAARKYPSLPVTAGIIAAILLLCLGIKTVWDHVAAPPKAALMSSNFVTSNVPAAGNGEAGEAAIVNSIPNQIGAGSTYATPIQPEYHDPFNGQQPTQSFSRPQERDQYAPQQYQQPRAESASEQNVPSYSSLRPLTVPSSSVPEHTVNVSVPQQNDHVVEVNPTSNAANSFADTSTDGDSQLPAPPPSHIFVTVHGPSSQSFGSGASPVTSDSGSPAISLRENAGASLQQKALNMQDAGNYKAAEAAYQAAIAAYQSDIAAGRGVQEAKSGIDTCKVALEICKQSQ